MRRNALKKRLRQRRRDKKKKEEDETNQKKAKDVEDAQGASGSEGGNLITVKDPKKKSSGAEAMEEGETLDPNDKATEGDDTDQQSVVINTGLDDSAGEEEAPTVSDKAIWDNARGHFKDRKPMCFAECKKGSSSYGIPDLIDKDGQSDDKEWLREERSDELASKFYNVWVHKLNNIHQKYYNYDQKYKIKWAVESYHVTRQNTCPFEICVMDKEKQKVYITRQRFLRHIVELHIHHHAVYHCLADKGKKNKNCKGLTSPRRGVMVRHYRDDHQKSASESRQMVMDTHTKMMENLDEAKLAKVTCSTKYFGTVSLSPKGKLTAEFGLSHEQMRLNMCEESWLKVKHHRGDLDEEMVDGFERMKAGRHRPSPDAAKRARVTYTH